MADVGLRVNEARCLDLADVKWELGRFGKLHIRHGKGARGPGPRERMVPLINEAGRTLRWFIAGVRGLFGDDYARHGGLGQGGLQAVALAGDRVGSAGGLEPLVDLGADQGRAGERPEPTRRSRSGNGAIGIGLTRITSARHAEPHRDGMATRLNWLRAAVLGANDGIVSTAGLVVGVADATASRTPAEIYQSEGP